MKKLDSIIPVSIVIPTFNGEKYIASIINTIQPYYDKHYEIVLVDDGSNSSDKTLEKFKHQFPNAICIRQNNKGLAAARNSGAKNASGKYLQFLDIDDTISENKIESQYKCALKLNADIVYSDWQMIIMNEGEVKKEPITISNQQNDIIESLLERWWNPCHSYLIKREAYWAINGGNEKLVNAQDFDIFIRMAIKGFKFKYLPGLHSFYYRYIKTTSLARGSRKQYWSDTERVIGNAIQLLKDMNNLNDKYKKAAAQRLFHVTRNVYKIDKKWAMKIIPKIYELDQGFKPKFVSRKFRFLYSLFGYKQAERIISLVK